MKNIPLCNLSLCAMNRTVYNSTPQLFFFCFDPVSTKRNSTLQTELVSQARLEATKPLQTILRSCRISSVTAWLKPTASSGISPRLENVDAPFFLTLTLRYSGITKHLLEQWNRRVFWKSYINRQYSYFHRPCKPKPKKRRPKSCSDESHYVVTVIVELPVLHGRVLLLCLCNLLYRRVSQVGLCIRGAGLEQQSVPVCTKLIQKVHDIHLRCVILYPYTSEHDVNKVLRVANFYLTHPFRTQSLHDVPSYQTAHA